jgi:hypothetical protein
MVMMLTKMIGTEGERQIAQALESITERGESILRSTFSEPILRFRRKPESEFVHLSKRNAFNKFTSCSFIPCPSSEAVSSEKPTGHQKKNTHAKTPVEE